MKEFYFKEDNVYYRKNDFRSDRQTLVFIHGLSGSSSAWLKFEEKFKKKYNVLTYDLRGHGKSVKFKNYEDYRAYKFVDDLNDLLEYLKIEKFVLISHSMGSLIALDFFSKYKEKVDKIVLLSPTFYIEKKWLDFILNKTTFRLAGFIDKLIKSPKKGGHVDYKKFINTGDWNIRRMIKDVSNTNLKIYLYGTKQYCHFDRRDFLKEIEVPVLIIHGKKDTIFPIKNSIKGAKEIKDSKMIILEDTDHIIVLNNFQEVSEAVEDFTESLID